MIGEAAVARYVRMKLSGHTPKKAKIEVYKDLEGKTVDRDKTFSVMFNPTQIGYTKGVKWVTKEIPEDDSGMKYSSGGEAPTFRIELMFDSTDTGKDVRDAYTDKLEKLTYIVHKDSAKEAVAAAGMPLYLGTLSVVPGHRAVGDALVPDVPGGWHTGSRQRRCRVPRVRPRGTIGSVVYEPDLAQPRAKIYRVAPGESLDFIAYQEYGDPALWKHIAATNNLSNPMDLRPGQVLKLVPLS